MPSINPALESKIQRLRQLRLALLHLHKSLLHFERDVYEQFHGRIRSNSDFFNLVLNDDWFNWLRPMSQLIVAIDVALDAKEEPVTIEKADALLDEARAMLRPAEDGTNMEQRYFRAIQSDPDIALKHAEIRAILQKKG